MLTYGKTSAVAVAAASYLAGCHAEGRAVASPEIAAARGLSHAHVAKVLTQLSELGLVAGTRGPGGGYRLGRAPEEISIADLVAPFERSRSEPVCPFGPEWCGKGDPCPLHDTMAQLMEMNLRVLRQTTLAVFAGRAAPAAMA